MSKRWTVPLSVFALAACDQQLVAPEPALTSPGIKVMARSTVEPPQDLGTLGGVWSFAYGINQRGDVVGDSRIVESPGYPRAFRWTAQNGMQDLGTLGPYDFGISSAAAYGINDKGEVVGQSSSASGTRAFLWNASGGMRDLGVLPGGFESSASGINNHGAVVGSSLFVLDDGDNFYRAFLWTASDGMQDLGVLPGGRNSHAFAVNNKGEVVGYSDGPTGDRAFLWTASGGMQNLGVLPGTVFGSIAYGINDRSQVVGGSFTFFGWRPFLWTASGGMQNLGILPDVYHNFATAINNSGQVVGSGDGISRAFIWTFAGGIQALGELPGGSYSGASGISDRGIVAGTSTSLEGYRAVRWQVRRVPTVTVDNSSSMFSGVVSMNDDSDAPAPVGVPGRTTFGPFNAGISTTHHERSAVGGPCWAAEQRHPHSVRGRCERGWVSQYGSTP
jgi:probable HAF family extracellular repeat protein